MILLCFDFSQKTRSQTQKPSLLTLCHKHAYSRSAYRNHLSNLVEWNRNASLGVNHLMKLISWNVNGLRAVLKKDFMTIFNELDADWFCLQETKLNSICLAIINTLTTLNAKAILVRPFSPNMNRSMSRMGWAFLNMILKAGSLP